MRVRLNEPPTAVRPAASRWARELTVDPIATHHLEPAQRAWIREWINALDLAEADDIPWTLGSWESIASKTHGTTQEAFHVLVAQEQLDQADHEFRIALAVQRQGEDVLVLVEVERRAGWLQSGFGVHGVRCRPPKWEDVWRRLKEQWDVEEDVGGEGTGESTEGPVGHDVGDTLV